MISFQSPEMLSDLYRDLRDRRLLPLVVVLLVGIAVVPMALSSSAQRAAPSVAPPAPVAEKSKAPVQQVVVADPGVRDYKRRLRNTPSDPFVQQYTSSPGGGAAQSALPGSASSGTTSTGSTGTPETGSTSTAPASTSGSSFPSSGGSPTTTTTTENFFTYRAKLRVGEVGGEMSVRDNVKGGAVLPSQNTPVAAFLGVTTNSHLQAQTAGFLVNSSVTLVSGTGTCTLVGSQCQLVALKPGDHADFTWIDGKTYRVTLVKFNLISRNKLPTGVTNPKRSGRDGRKAAAQGSGDHFSF